MVVLWIMALGWCAFCLVAGLLAAANSTAVDRAQLLYLSGIAIGALPVVAMLWHARAGARRAIRRVSVRPVVAHPAPHYQRHEISPPRLPGRLQMPWNRLAQAWNVVSELQRQGWIDAGSTRGLPESMARLHRLGVADGMTDQLGGRRSSTVEQQIIRLGELLVALADEAVEHQATVGSDFSPATLTAAAQRLAADSAAYRELMELGGVWQPNNQA
ncbi:hypothetical protein ACWIHP_26190 [Nocardia fluminea]